VVRLGHTEYTRSPWKDKDLPENIHPHRHSPVILIHGLLGSKRNFASIATSLSLRLKKRRRIVAVDLRNHGDNEHDWREDMTYADMASDVAGFMDEMGFDRAVLVGHSMGGKVAKALALTRPERVSGLVVLDIAPVRYRDEDQSWGDVKRIIQAIASVSLEEGMTKRDVDSKLRSFVKDPALRAFVLTNIDSSTPSSLRWKINIRAIAQRLHDIAGFDIQADNNATHLQYHGDTFFIHGGASRFVRHSHMSSIANYFPNHMLTTIRGVGHWVHAEAPDDTLALLERYLDR